MKSRIYVLFVLLVLALPLRGQNIVPVQANPGGVLLSPGQFLLTNIHGANGITILPSLVGHGIIISNTGSGGGGSGDVTTAQLNSASNSLRTAFGAADATYGTAVSNGAVAVVIANDTTTSNALRTAYLTADFAMSNVLATALIANDGTTSNALRTDYLTKAFATSNLLAIATSNNVQITAGANVSVTPSSSGGVMTYSIAAAGGGGGGSGDIYAPGQFTIVNFTNVFLKNGLSVTNLNDLGTLVAAQLSVPGTGSFGSIVVTNGFGTWTNNYLTGDINTSNGIVALIIANDVTTSNSLRTAYLTADFSLSNVVATAVIANDATTSNALTVAYLASDAVASNALRTAYLTSDFAASNVVAQAALNNDVTTSNALRTAYLTADFAMSNLLVGTIVANDNTTSNALTSAYLVSDQTASNALRTAYLTAVSAASNVVATALIANDNTTSNALTTAYLASDAVASNALRTAYLTADFAVSNVLALALDNKVDETTGFATNLTVATSLTVAGNQTNAAGTYASIPQIYLGDGSLTAPGLTFATDTNLGIYRVAANTLGFSLSTSLRAQLGFVSGGGLFSVASSGGGAYGAGATPGAPDVFWARQAPAVWAQRNGDSAQTNQLYNYTFGASVTSSTNSSWLEYGFSRFAGVFFLRTMTNFSGTTAGTNYPLVITVGTNLANGISIENNGLLVAKADLSVWGTGNFNTLVVSNGLGSWTNNYLTGDVNTSNGVVAVVIANDVTTSNALRTAYLTADFAASNVVATALIANDVTTSNALRTAYLTADFSASNVVATALIANDNTTSNALTVAYLASDATASNALRTAYLTADFALSNVVATAVIANDNTTSNALRTAYLTESFTASNVVATALIANDTTTSNALRTAYLTAVFSASNVVATAVIANDVTTSNALTVAFLASDAVASNALRTAYLTADFALSNVVATALIANDITTSNGVVTYEATQLATKMNSPNASASTITVTNGIGFVTALESGTGGFATNYSILATNGDAYINGGLTNVSIRHSVGATAGIVLYWNRTITNGVSNRTLEFSSITNAWHFAGCYGTNAPSVLTNNTKLFLAGRQDGTNIDVGYAYFSWP